MPNRLIGLAALAVAWFAVGAASATIVSVRDDASVDVPRSVFGGAPSEALKQEARRQAVDRAWRRYQAQNASGARASLFAQHAQELRQQAEQLCNFSFYEESFDKDAARFSLKVRASCDQKAIDAALNRLAGSGAAATSVAAGSKQGFTFVFVARRAADATQYIDRVTKTTSSTVSTTGNESASESARQSGGSSASTAQDGASVTQAATSVSKGTVDRRDTAYRYKVEQSEGVDNAVTNVLTTAGFEVAKYSDVIGACPGVSLDEVVGGFAEPKPNQAELIAPDLRRRMIASAKQCEMAFFATGIVDILKSERQADDTELVTVALTIDVRDIRKLVPTAVAAIPRVQFQQKGRDRIEAANKALAMAAESGAREIVDMLRQRGIQ